jgi:hypothetical protein
VLILAAGKKVVRLFIVVLLQLADQAQLELAVFLWFILVPVTPVVMLELVDQVMLGWQHNGTRYTNSIAVDSGICLAE